MDPGFPCHFPNGGFFKKREGSTLQVGEQTVSLDKVIKETFSSFLSDYTVLFEGRAMTDQEDSEYGQPVVLKLFYQMWPGHHHEEDYRPRLYGLGRKKFLHQCRALKALGPTGYFPEYVASGETKQSDDGPYPGGYPFMLVMTKLEGSKFRYDATKGELVLGRDDMQFIKREVINAHEAFRQRGWYMSGDIDKSFYNKGKKRLFYLGGFDKMSERSPNELIEPITESSGAVRIYWSMIPKAWWENGYGIGSSSVSEYN